MNVEQIDRRFEYGLATNSTLAGAMIIGRQAGLSEVDTLKLAAVELADQTARLMARIIKASALGQPSPVVINVSDLGEVATIVGTDDGGLEDSHDAARKSIAAGEFVSDDEFLAMATDYRHQ